MTNYLPHSTKKLAILQRRELALFKLIDEKAPHKKIVDAAEHLETDEIAYLVPSLPQDTVAALLSSLDQRERHKRRPGQHSSTNKTKQDRT